MARGLFVEPFYGGSHRAFLDGLVRHSAHHFTLLTLEDGEWRRRMRRGAHELAAAAAQLDGDFGFLVATDMLDLPAFLALTRPRFSHLPIMLYLHENQLTYPRLRGTKFNSWFGAMNYLSACAADVVAFNSEFHRSDFLAALEALSSQPNNWIAAGTVQAIAGKSTVVPVGVDLGWMDAYAAGRRRSATEPPIVLWNHRWEFDKAPEVFIRTVRKLAEEGVPFRLALAGEPGNSPSGGPGVLRDEFPERIHHFGYADDRATYARLLWESDIVVSTTRHEFFGVGMVEALYCGCFPIAPSGFNFTALVPPELQGAALFESEEDCASKLRAAIVSRPGGDSRLRRAAARFAWPAVIGEWDARLAELATTRRR